MSPHKTLKTFVENASSMSAVIHDAPNIEQALETAVQLCIQKPAALNLMPGRPGTDETKMIAAPNLVPDALSTLESLCAADRIRLLKSGIREFPGGFEMGITTVNLGIAETGTLVLASDSEDTRLSTMLCETHVAILDKKKIYQTASDCADLLQAMLDRPSSYTAFITGPSRTADIERVLAIGVHGPLELHIILTGELS